MLALITALIYYGTSILDMKSRSRLGAIWQQFIPGYLSIPSNNLIVIIIGTVKYFSLCFFFYFVIIGYAVGLCFCHIVNTFMILTFKFPASRS